MDDYEDEEFIDYPARRRKVLLLGITTLAVIVAAFTANRGDNDKQALVAGGASTTAAVATTAAPATAPLTTGVAPVSVAGTTATATTRIPATTAAPTTVPATTGAATDALLFRRPMNGKVIVSLAWDCYDCVDWPTLRGKHHPAVDYTSDDRRIVASADGVVEKINTGCANGVAGCGNSYGNWIFLKHNLADGRVLYSFYAHLSELSPSIKVGACIKTAQQVGVMGNSGISSAAHLHYNVQTNTNLLEYTSASSAQFGSVNPETLYGKVRVKACS